MLMRFTQVSPVRWLSNKMEDDTRYQIEIENEKFVAYELLDLVGENAIEKIGTYDSLETAKAYSWLWHEV